MKQWLTPIIGYFLFIGAIRKREASKKLAIAIMVSTVIIGILTMKESIDKGTLSTWEKSRVDGVFYHSNTLGAFFVYYSFLIAGVFLTHMRKPAYWLLAIPFLMCFRGMSLTVSRGAIVSFFFAGLVTVFIRSRFLFILSVTIMILLILHPSILPATISGRFVSTLRYETDLFNPSIEQTLESSAKSRIEIIRGSKAMIAQHPLLGIGYGMHLYLIGIDTHNTFLKIAVEMGLIALGIFVLILGIIFLSTFYVYRHTDDLFMKGIALGYLGGLGGVFVCNFFGSRLDGTEFVTYFWILAAIMMRERHYLKQKKYKESEEIGESSFESDYAGNYIHESEMANS